jgi:hypothetical protein
VGLERGPLSLVSTTEELLERNSSSSGLENRDYGRRDPSRWLRNTLYPQKLSLTSPTSGDCSFGIVRSHSGHGVCFVAFQKLLLSICSCWHDVQISAMLASGFSSSGSPGLERPMSWSTLKLTACVTHRTSLRKPAARRQTSPAPASPNGSWPWTYHVMWSLWSPLRPTHVSFKSLNAIKI